MAFRSTDSSSGKLEAALDSGSGSAEGETEEEAEDDEEDFGAAPFAAPEIVFESTAAPALSFGCSERIFSPRPPPLLVAVSVGWETFAAGGLLPADFPPEIADADEEEATRCAAEEEEEEEEEEEG